MARRVLKALVRLLYRLTTVGSAKGPHVTRYFMYNRIAQSGLEPHAEHPKVLSISHSEGLAKLLGFDGQHIVDAPYPEFNVLELSFEDETFDAVVSDQVLEHVEGDPRLAVSEMFRVLKPNGICLHTTCFINPVHECPKDYWRFTPDALRLLTARYGDVLDVGGWGNPYVWPFVFMGLRNQPIPHWRWHPAHWVATLNDPLWPIVTWVLARKHAH